MMTYIHVLASAGVALVFGVLIDIDHGITRDNIKCALSLDEKDCLHAGVRGVFHEKFLWGLLVCGVVAWTIHLWMDGVL